MDSQEAEARYRSLTGLKSSGKITAEEYYREVTALRYQDHTGTWWAISPADGSWLRWDGAAWQAAFPGGNAAAGVPAAPGTLAGEGTGMPGPGTGDPGTGTAPSPAGTPADPAIRNKPGRNLPGIFSTLAGIIAWFLLPLGFGLLAIAAGAYSLVRSKKRRARVSYFALAGILLGASAMIADLFFYHLFFPGMLPP